MIVTHVGNLQHYFHVLQNTNETYRTSSTTVDAEVMIMRLGYKYYWHISGREGQPCKFCDVKFAHTLERCVLGCEKIQSYRNVVLRI